MAFLKGEFWGEDLGDMGKSMTRVNKKQVVFSSVCASAWLAKVCLSVQVAGWGLGLPQSTKLRTRGCCLC